MRTGVVFAAAALTVTAGVAGCGGSAGSPQALPSLSPAASASPSPSPVPTGAQAPTAQGATDFVRFFYSEITRGYQERDPQIVSALSLPTCKTCKLYIDSITTLRNEDQRFTGGGFKIKFAVAPGDTGTSESARVDVGFDFNEAIVYAANGHVVDTTPAQPGVEEEVALNRVDGNWRVATLKRIVRK
jgi:hypothetical protein